MSVIYWIEINLSYLGLSGSEAFRLKYELEDSLNQLGIGEVTTPRYGPWLEHRLHQRPLLLRWLRPKVTDGQWAVQW